MGHGSGQQTKPQNSSPNYLIGIKKGDQVPLDRPPVFNGLGIFRICPIENDLGAWEWLTDLTT